MRALFGGLIAVILLGLYLYAVSFAVAVAKCLGTTGCTTLTVESFTDGFANTMTTVGGLVSALVIAELALTNPGEAPAARALSPGASEPAKRVLKVLTGIYLLAWVGAGLIAYVVGGMQYPGKLQPLTDLGQTWLGLAVASAYAYFGLKSPNKSKGDG